MSISAAQVKELRDITGAGFMDCKKALTESNGDMDLAVDNMRKLGIAKAAKKSSRISAEGVINIVSNDSNYLIIEVNCETDFVAKDDSFLAFVNQVSELALNEKITNVESLNSALIDGQSVDDIRVELVAKIGENISIRRLTLIDAEGVGSYLHGKNIGVLVKLNQTDAEIAKHIAMHIAASNPQYLKGDDIPEEVVQREYNVQLDLAVNSGKPKEIAEKMVIGRMNKFKDEISLLGQSFILDTSMTVGAFLKSKNIEVTQFLRLEVGEGIEKEEQDFAAEVAAQVAASKG